MKELNVYDYNNPREFLWDVLRKRQSVNPRYSLRAWARQAGFKHHSMVSMVLNGKRRLKPEIASALKSSISLSKEESRYFDVLVLFHNAKSDPERELYAGLLKDLNPTRSFSELKLDVVRVLSDWKHFILIDLFHLKDFRQDPRWIAEKMGKGLNRHDVQTMLDRLQRVGLLTQDKDGKYSPTQARLHTPDDTVDLGVQKIHKQILDAAKEAIDHQSLEEREINSYSLAVQRDQIPDAKKAIRDFREKFSKQFESTQGDDVYQLAVQFFRLTTSTEKEKENDN